MNATFTYRLYTNEFLTAFVQQISNNVIEGLYCTDESTDKVLVITATEADIIKLQSLMYETDITAIKSVFPSFKTLEEMKEDAEKTIKMIEVEMAKMMLTLINKYEGTGISLFKDTNYAKMHEAYMAIAF